MLHPNSTQPINGQGVRLTRVQRDLRQLDLTSHGVALLCGVTPRAVQYWRSGGRHPRSPNGFRLHILAALVRRVEDRTLELLCDAEGRS